MPAAIALPGPTATALPEARAAKPAKHVLAPAHAPGFAALLTQAEAKSSGRDGVARTPRASASQGKANPAATVAAADTQTAASTSGPAAAGLGVLRSVSQRAAEAKNGPQATPQPRAMSIADPQAASLPEAEAAFVSTGAGSGGDLPQDEAGAAAPQEDGLPEAAGSGQATPAPPAATAASEQAAAPNSPAPPAASGGAPNAKLADPVAPAGAPAAEAAGAAFPDDVIASHDPAAHTAAPAGQAVPDAVLSSSTRAGLAEARETVALRVAHAAQDGVQTVSIDLHPAELGHVGIELSFHDGGVSVQMTLARHETYEAFARDRAALEQQLTQSGLTLGSGGLDLRFGQKQDQPPAFAGPQTAARARVPQPADVSAGPAAMPRAGDGLLNIIA